VKRLADCRLYGILDLGYVRPEAACDIVRQMIEGGIDILQLRAKNLAIDQIERIGLQIEPLTSAAGVPLIINDHPEIVPVIGAQGAHVGQDDRPVADARWRAGRALAGEVPPPLIGKSTHSMEQAVAAASEGADYIGFGPLYATPTKPGRPAIGLGDVQRVNELVRIPIFCIGGINLETLPSVLAAGAKCVVVVSAILQAADITAYCRALKSKIQNLKS